MSKKLKFYGIIDEMFNAKLSLYVGSREEYNKEVKRLELHDVFLANNTCQGHFGSDGEKGYTVIWLESLDNIAVLSHELIHLTFYVLEWDGLKSDLENDELFAHYHTMMFKKVLALRK